MPTRSVRLSGLPAYVRASRFVIQMLGSDSNSRWMKLAPMNPQPPVTRILLIEVDITFLLAARESYP
jgi:hypothetical protein